MTTLKPAATLPVQQRDCRGWLFAFAAFILAVDRLTKVWVSRHVAMDDAITVIPRVFRITHVLNPGAAFSLFNDSPSPGRIRLMLISFSVIAAVAVFVALIKMGRRITPTTVALACILAGALGNVYDRVRFGTVIDFLEVHIFSYHWPDFNVADSAIVIGGLLLLLDAFRSHAPEAFEQDGSQTPQSSMADEHDASRALHSSE